MSKKKKLTKRELKKSYKVRGLWLRIKHWQEKHKEELPKTIERINGKEVEVVKMIKNINEFKAYYYGSGKNFNYIKYHLKYKNNIETAKAILSDIKELGLKPKDISSKKLLEDIKVKTTSEIIDEYPELAKDISRYREILFEQGFSKAEVKEQVASYYFGS